KHLGNFHSHLTKPTDNNHTSADYFRHNDLIVRKLTVLISVFSDLSKNQTPETKPDSKTREALLSIQEIYTIESERFVLQWLINNTHSDEKSLFEEYNSRFYKEENLNVAVDDIELF